MPDRVLGSMKKRFAFAAVGSMWLSGCGSGSGSDAGRTTSAAIESNAEVSPLPAIEVDDVTDDRRVALDAFVPSDRPTLIWFWAPH